MTIFPNRTEAGRLLAGELQEYSERPEVIVLALPRGGVPVASEVASALEVELDVLIVRKLGHPHQPELAIGAIASGGVRVLNERMRISENVVEEVARDEERELQRREREYRGARPYPDLEERCVILVDDGLATGATMRAAISAVRQEKPERIVVAVPVAPPETVLALRREADEVVCLTTPSQFFGIGQFYEDFSQTRDEHVRELLQRAWQRIEARVK